MQACHAALSARLTAIHAAGHTKTLILLNSRARVSLVRDDPTGTLSPAKTQ
jgi:hypothetical protein